MYVLLNYIFLLSCVSYSVKKSLVVLISVVFTLNLQCLPWLFIDYNVHGLNEMNLCILMLIDYVGTLPHNSIEITKSPHLFACRVHCFWMSFTLLRVRSSNLIAVLCQTCAAKTGVETTTMFIMMYNYIIMIAHAIILCIMIFSDIHDLCLHTILVNNNEPSDK